jgi:hypothetical protein
MSTGLSCEEISALIRPIEIRKNTNNAMKTPRMLASKYLKKFFIRR